MTNYERNNTMVACILAFIIVGAVAVGAMFLLGTANLTWNPNINTTGDWDEGELFEFELTDTSMPATVTLNVDIDVGGLQVLFVDDADLVYEISIWVPNATLEEHGDPTVGYASDTITIDYPVAGVNVTLGSGTTYVMGLATTTGGVEVILSSPANVGDIDIHVTTGGIHFVMTSAVNITGDVDFSFRTTTGGIDVDASIPINVGGSFAGTVTTGSVDVTPVGWTLISQNHYETSNYATASNSITIVASTTTGGIEATLT
ncbi:MAG: hypothetical protein P1Q69_11185 [Candidatus Thorarchaeota archaeon]|nr:hypothetical protein [Candidatus Thorarchaeota archaeon]